MRALDIIDYNRRLLGRLSVGPTGRVRLEVMDRAYHPAFGVMMRDILGSPLPLRTYEPVFDEKGVSIHAHVRHLTPRDPDYLWAVRAYLEKHPLGSTKVLGRFSRIPDPQPVAGPASNGDAR